MRIRSHECVLLPRPLRKADGVNFLEHDMELVVLDAQGQPVSVDARIDLSHASEPPSGLRTDDFHVFGKWIDENCKIFISKEGKYYLAIPLEELPLTIVRTNG